MNNFKPLLIIDGNFFANRCIGILNQGDLINNLESDIECQHYKEAFKYQLYKLWEAYSKYFHNFIIVKDGYSWRKDLVYKPYYMENIPESELVIGYKEQRIKQKEESPINYKNLYRLFEELMTEFIDSNINISYSERLEGDDLIYLLTKEASAKKIDTCIFATDRDLTQLVNEYTVMFSCIKSKKHNNGVFFVNPQTYIDIFCNKNMYDILLCDENLRRNYYRNLISCNIYDTNVSVQRINGNGIEFATPYKTVLTKIICGDISDNIFPLYRWFKGERKYSVTEKMIDKAFVMNLMENFDETPYKDILEHSENDDQLFKDFFSCLSTICKQCVNAEKIYEHFKFNKVMVEISDSNIPKQYITDSKLSNIDEIEKNVPFMLSDLKESLKMDTTQINDTATNFLRNSIK